MVAFPIAARNPALKPIQDPIPTPAIRLKITANTAQLMSIILQEKPSPVTLAARLFETAAIELFARVP